MLANFTVFFLRIYTMHFDLAPLFSYHSNCSQTSPNMSHSQLHIVIFFFSPPSPAEHGCGAIHQSMGNLLVATHRRKMILPPTGTISSQ